MDNERHNIKVLINTFHSNGHAQGFQTQTYTLEPPCIINSTTWKYSLTALIRMVIQKLIS